MKSLSSSVLLCILATAFLLAVNNSVYAEDAGKFSSRFGSHAGEYQKAPSPFEIKDSHSSLSASHESKSKFYESKYECVGNTLSGYERYMLFGYLLKENVIKEECVDGSYCITSLENKPTPSGHAQCLKPDKLFDDYKECAGPTMKKLKIGVGGITYYIDVQCPKDSMCVAGECTSLDNIYCNDDDGSNYNNLVQGVMDKSIITAGSVEFGSYENKSIIYNDTCKDKTKLEEYACIGSELKMIGINCSTEFKDTYDQNNNAVCKKDSEGRGYCDISKTTLINNDGDNLPDVMDNCPNITNPDQNDKNKDGIGDACIVTFAKSYGSGNMSGSSFLNVFEMPDGSYIAGGTSGSAIGFVGQFMRLDKIGDVIWSKGLTYARKMNGVKSGGYVFINFDGYIARVDENNNLTWQTTYPSDYQSIWSSVHESNDGGFIVAGGLNFDNEFSGYGFYNTVWVSKFNDLGKIKWQKVYKTSDPQIHYSNISASPTSDGGSIISGYSKEGLTSKYLTPFIINLNTDGEIKWQKEYGVPEMAEKTMGIKIYSVREANDGGYIAVGAIYEPSSAYTNLVILKLDEVGNIVWQKRASDETSNAGTYINSTSSGGYIIAGNKLKYVNDASKIAWILKIENEGNVIWQKTFGGPHNDEIMDIMETSDGGFIAVGLTRSFVTSDMSSADAWVLKMTADGNIYDECPEELGTDSSVVFINSNLKTLNAKFEASTVNIQPGKMCNNIIDVKTFVSTQCDNIE